MHLYVLAFDLLHGLFLARVVLPILVEFWEAGPHIVHEQLREFLVAFVDEAEELAVVVVDNIAYLLLEREWLQFFP